MYQQDERSTSSVFTLQQPNTSSFKIIQWYAAPPQVMRHGPESKLLDRNLMPGQFGSSESIRHQVGAVIDAASGSSDK